MSPERSIIFESAARAATARPMSVDALRPADASPLTALLAATTEMSRHTTSPEEMANHLAFLQIDLSDPEFHRHMLELSRRTEAGYRALLNEAIAAGEIIPCDTARLARAISALAGGSLIGWAVYRRGPAEAWVRNDLETLLAPYRQGSRRRVRKPRRTPHHTGRKSPKS
jgi:hypothetical protein